MARTARHGLRKICGCKPAAWTKGAHPYHFAYKWAGVRYRFSLDRVLPTPVRLKGDAEAAANQIRAAIQAGTFRMPDTVPPASVTAQTSGPILSTLTLTQLLETYRTQYLCIHRPDTLKNTSYQIGAILRTVLERPNGERRPFGDWLVCDITTDTIEAYRTVRLQQVTTGVNRDLQLLRHLFNWATSKKRRLASDNPFLDGVKPAIRLQTETARTRRLQTGEETRLLNVCKPHLQALVVAAIETGCRKGELLSLQWWQVRFAPKPEIFLPAYKTKTKTDRTIPISTRLRAILEMRRTDPTGCPLPDAAYVFGTPTGEPIGSFKRAWECALLKMAGYTPQYVVRVVNGPDGPRRHATAALTPECRAHLHAINLTFHDLRRTAGSRWLDAGVALHRIQRWLGHANISQTSTYLAANATDDDDAMRRFEEAHARLAQLGTAGATSGHQGVLEVDAETSGHQKHLSKHQVQ